MSFRTRLISFFFLIVVLPMVAVGFLVFRLIDQSQQGKVDARVNGIATAAASVYQSERGAARTDAAALAGDVRSLRPAALQAQVPQLEARAGLARVRIVHGSSVLFDSREQDAVAPGTVTARLRGPRGPLTITVSETTAGDYARRLMAPGVAVVLRTEGSTLGATRAVPTRQALPAKGTVSVGRDRYRVVTLSAAGFDHAVLISVLSSLGSGAGSSTSSRLLAVAFIVAFVLLAFGFSMLASRKLQDHIKRFLEAARRLAGGDFSSPVPVEGRDEFAALGREFNQMSAQLQARLDELTAERARLRASVRRIGQSFASNLDRQALLELALRTAIDAVSADCGRLSARARSEAPLAETSRIASLDGIDEAVLEAERLALQDGGLGEVRSGDLSVITVALGSRGEGGRTQGLITLARHGDAFSDDDRDILHSLGSQATLALENVDFHLQVSRQAVTDGLTGLANHRSFQDLMSLEIEQVRRYQHPLGLIMLDLDNFKSINDTYGHQQGDIVLKYVARVLRENSREVDVAARYGGEEMALLLPHTDLDGAYVIAERVRSAIEDLRIPRLDAAGQLRVTASVGVASSARGEKAELIAGADTALYTAKRAGKNRTLRAVSETANVVGAE